MKYITKISIITDYTILYPSFDKGFTIFNYFMPLGDKIKNKKAQDKQEPTSKLYQPFLLAGQY